MYKRQILESGMLDYSNIIDLSHDVFDDRCIELLVNHKNAQIIKTLYLNSCGLHDDHFLALLGPKSMLKSLKVLHLDGNCLTNDVMSKIAPLKKLKALSILSLSSNRIGASGASEICGGSDWDYLYFNGNNASSDDDDIYKLIDWYWSSSIGDYIDIVDEAR